MAKKNTDTKVEEVDQTEDDDVDLDDADIEPDIDAEDLDEDDLEVDIEEDIEDPDLDDFEEDVDAVAFGDDDDDDDDEDQDEETTEALEELESQELQLLDEEKDDNLLVDEVEMLRSIRREELTMNVDAQSKRADEFVCQSCFMLKRTSQLANKRKQLCADCAD